MTDELLEKLITANNEKSTKIIPENLKTGITAFGVTGTFTEDATATAGDIMIGQTAYVNGNKITGTYEAGSLPIGNSKIISLKSLSETVPANRFIDFATDMVLTANVNIVSDVYSGYYFDIVNISDTLALAVYSSNNTNKYLTYCVLQRTTSGSFSKPGTGIILEEAIAYPQIVKVDADRFLITYTKSNLPYAMMIKLNSDYTVTTGTEIQISSNAIYAGTYSCINPSVVLYDTNHVICTHTFGTTTTTIYGTLSHLLINNLTITLEAQYNLTDMIIGKIFVEGDKLVCFGKSGSSSPNVLYCKRYTFDTTDWSISNTETSNSVSGLYSYIFNVVKTASNKYLIRYYTYNGEASFVTTNDYRCYMCICDTTSTPVINDSCYICDTGAYNQFQPFCFNNGLCVMADSTHNQLVVKIIDDNTIVGAKYYTSYSAQIYQTVYKYIAFGNYVYLFHNQNTTTTQYKLNYSRINTLPSDVYVKLAETNIKGITKSECSTDTAGNVAILNI